MSCSNNQTVTTSCCSSRPRNKNYILVEGLHKPIIDEKTWKIVLAKRSLNSVPVKHNNIVKNPLSGLIICELIETIWTCIPDIMW